MRWSLSTTMSLSRIRATRREGAASRAPSSSKKLSAVSPRPARISSSASRWPIASSGAPPRWASRLPAASCPPPALRRFASATMKWKSAWESTASRDGAARNSAPPTRFAANCSKPSSRISRRKKAPSCWCSSTDSAERRSASSTCCSIRRGNGSRARTFALRAR